MTARKIKFDIRQATRPLLIVLGVWTLVAAASYLFLVRPKAVEFHQLQDGNAPQIEAFNVFRQEVESRESFLDAVHRAEEDLAVLRTDVLSTKSARVIEVQAELAELCLAFKIDLLSVNYDNDTLEEEGLEKMIMVVPLEGSYAALRKFLQAVEASDKFLLVEKVALNEGKEGGVLLQLSITLTTYFDMPETRRGPARRTAGRA